MHTYSAVEQCIRKKNGCGRFSRVFFSLSLEIINFPLTYGEYVGENKYGVAKSSENKHYSPDVGTEQWMLIRMLNLCFLGNLESKIFCVFPVDVMLKVSLTFEDNFCRWLIWIVWFKHFRFHITLKLTGHSGKLASFDKLNVVVTRGKGLTKYYFVPWQVLFGRNHATIIGTLLMPIYIF